MTSPGSALERVLRLAIVRQVAEQHGGSVAVSNVDGEAEFSLVLPGTKINGAR